jgi:ATP-dependent Zn protease
MNVLRRTESSPSSAEAGGSVDVIGRAARSEYRTAVHESGHVVTARSCGLSIDGATIVAEQERAGCVWLTPNNIDCKPLREFSDARFGRPSIDGRQLSHTTGVLVYARTVNMLAGAAAERLIFSDQACGDQNDLRAAMFYASMFADPAAFMANARADAERILAARRSQVEAVAAALIERKTLDGAEIDDVLSLTPAQRLERARRRRWAATVASAGASGRVFEPLRM